MQKKEVTSCELTTKSLKAVTDERVSGGTDSRFSKGLNYEKAAAEAINNVTQDLAPKKIEQRLKPDLERDTLDCKTKTRDEGQSNSQEHLKHLENGDWETLRYYEDMGEDHENTSICINV